MRKSFVFIVITTLFLIISIKSYSQAENNPSEIGIFGGTFFNLGGSQMTEETIASFDLATYFRKQRHEFYLGIIYPFLIPAISGYLYLDTKKIGGLAGYKFYLLNPRHRANIFAQYEFQYIYFTGHYEEGNQSGKTYIYHTVYSYLHNVFGVGFVAFFDKKHRFGVSGAVGYIIPLEFYKRTEGLIDCDELYKWGDNDMNNYFNLNLSFCFKLIPCKRDGNK